MKSTFDATVFFGDYPFRGFANTSLEALSKRCQHHQIDGAAVSSFDQIFWENNLDATRRDAALLEKHPSFRHFVVVNPAYPNQLAEMEKVLSRFPVAGLRLLPNYHQYHLWDSCVTDLFALAHSHGLPVQIHREIQDQRLQWLLVVPPVASGELEWLLANPPSVKVLLSGLTHADLQQLQSKILQAPHVWADLSRVRGPVFGIEKLTALIEARRLVYGTLWPIQNISSTLLQIQEAQINEDDKTRILGDNYHRFLS